MEPTIPACLVSEQEFDESTAGWAQLLNSPDPVLLGPYFTGPDGGPFFTHAYLPAAEIMHLVSAVGTVTIKARFAIRPLAGLPAFTVMLFGADANNKPTTAYFAAIAGVKPADSAAVAAAAEGPVPECLALEWITNWEQVTQIDRTQFKAPDGPLRGYTFRLADFLDTLFPLSAVTGEYLRISFALHKYYKPGPVAEAAAATFGLVLSMTTDPFARKVATGSLFYDISMPCPSTC